MDLKLFNTLNRKKESFQPTHGTKVSLYTCGPTVYDYAHIGNLRSFIMADVLFRVLTLHGYDVSWVMNITDIDDKTIKGTILEYGPGASVSDLYTYTQKYLDAFLNDLSAVNVSKDSIRFIRVTDHIPEIQAFIIELIDRGYAYKADDGSTYFSIERYQKDFGDYGTLVGKDFLEGKHVGTRVAHDEYEKDNLSDFALWKAHSNNDGNIFWDHPILGKGRPGWHIECSAINKIAFNGQTTDIHTGGIDLVFPHHTNEIAQTQPLYTPFVRHWFHSEHLLIGGQKMAKSAPETNITLRTIEEQQTYSGLDFRYFALGAQYNKKLSFNWDALAAARTTRQKITHRFGQLPTTPEPDEQAMQTKILDALDNDLNTPVVLALVQDALSRGISQNFITWTDHALGLNIFKEYKKATDIPAAIQELAQKREACRQEKRWDDADAVRLEIEKAGFRVEDTPSGYTIHKL